MHLLVNLTNTHRRWLRDKSFNKQIPNHGDNVAPSDNSEALKLSLKWAAQDVAKKQAAKKTKAEKPADAAPTPAKVRNRHKDANV